MDRSITETDEDTEHYIIVGLKNDNKTRKLAQRGRLFSAIKDLDKRRWQFIPKVSPPKLKTLKSEKHILIRKRSCRYQSRMKQVTIMMRALGFLVIVGCSKAKYLLVEIADDEYVPIPPLPPLYPPPPGILYSFEKI